MTSAGIPAEGGVEMNFFPLIVMINGSLVPRLLIEKSLVSTELDYILDLYTFSYGHWCTRVIATAVNFTI